MDKSLEAQIKELDKIFMESGIGTPANTHAYREARRLRAALAGETVEEGEAKATAIQEKDRSYNIISDHKPIAQSDDNPHMIIDPTRPCSRCHTYCCGDCE